MTIIFLMFIPALLLLFRFNQQVRIVLMLLNRQFAQMAGGNIYYNLLPAVAGTAYTDAEKDDTGESPKDPGPTQPVKQSRR